MKDKHLDDIIRGKLEGLYVPYQPHTWEQFEQRLDAQDSGVPESREADLDEAVFNKLHQLDSPYHSEHWSRMSERLDREFVRPEQVLRYKIMELTLILLIAVTFWQFIPTPPAGEPPVTGSVASSPSAIHTDEKKATPSGEAPAGSVAEDLSSASASWSEAERTSQLDRATGFDPAWPPAGPGLNGSVQLPQLPSQQALIPLTPIEAKAAPIAGLISSGNKTPQAPASLLAGLPNTAASTLTESLPFGDFEQQVHPLRPDRYFYFGMFGGPEYNRIITPSDYFLDVETNEFDRYELGYSGGVSAGFGLGDWEIQSGFIYTAKEYPSINLLLRHGNSRDGYTVEQFKDVQLNIIQVPLNLRYNIFHYDRWRLYAIAGAALNVATQANYFIDKEGSRRSVLSERIENGWLEGGTFRENSFLTGNIGFGFERFVTSRWSFFAQPTYQHTVYSFNHGFGPTNDRMNTLSIYTGIRIRLKR